MAAIIISQKVSRIFLFLQYYFHEIHFIKEHDGQQLKCSVLFLYTIDPDEVKNATIACEPPNRATPMTRIKREIDDDEAFNEEYYYKDFLEEFNMLSTGGSGESFGSSFGSTPSSIGSSIGSSFGSSITSSIGSSIGSSFGSSGGSGSFFGSSSIPAESFHHQDDKRNRYYYLY